MVSRLVVTRSRPPVPSVTDTWRVLHAPPYKKMSLLHTQVEPETHPSHIYSTDVPGASDDPGLLGSDNPVPVPISIWPAINCWVTVRQWLSSNKAMRPRAIPSPER